MDQSVQEEEKEKLEIPFLDLKEIKDTQVLME